MKEQTLNADARIQIVEIGHQMNGAGLSKSFTASAVQIAFEFEGVFDLMKLWAAEKDKAERDATVADLQDMIDECSQKEKEEGAHVRFDDLEKVGETIRAFKNQLRKVVEQQGGIEPLADLTGIPQPSLARFFGSVSVPRKITLLKIAKALGLSQTQIATEWSR